MEFGFTEEQQTLQKEIRDFFLKELPRDFHPGTSHRRTLNKKQLKFWMEMQKKAGAKGYLAPGWPKESGGLGLSDIEQAIVLEQNGYWDIIWPGYMGTRVCGPPLNVFGTEEQKKKFLPGIAKGEAIWYEAFTEPDAGSETANVSLRAVADGDFFVFNGQKHFMSSPAPADYLYTLARTSNTTPKHRGLSLFLIDARTPGISYRPMPTMGNFTQQIFFDNVRVPKDRLLGELNRGFYHAMVTFEFERTNTERSGNARRNLEELVQLGKDEKRNGKPLIDDSKWRDMLADNAIQWELAYLGGWRDAWFFSQRKRLGAPPPSTSAYREKVDAAPQAKAVMDAMGLYGQLKRNSKYVKWDGQAERNWQFVRSMHPAGTVEINKVVLADRGLRLPRIPNRLNKDISKAISEEK